MWKQVTAQVRDASKKRDEAKVTASLEAWLHSLDRSDPAHEHHRLEALWTYQTITTRRSPSLIHEVLQSPDPRVRAAAIRVLYHWGGAAQTLAEAITDSDPQVRREAVTALGQFASPEALVVALGVLNQPMDSYLDFALWRTCSLLEPYWLPAFQRGDLKPGANAEHLGYALKAIEKPEALAPLMKMILSDRADEAIVRLVGKIGSPIQLDTILQLAHREYHSLTRAAALALAEARHSHHISYSNMLRFALVFSAGDVACVVEAIARAPPAPAPADDCFVAPRTLVATHELAKVDMFDAATRADLSLIHI